MDRKSCYELVITAEIRAQKLYLGLAMSFKNPETSAVFQELVMLERNHEQKMRAAFGLEFGNLEPKIGSTAEPEIKDLDLKEPVEVLRFAITREDTAAQKYIELAEDTADAELKAMLLDFAGEEEGHKQVLLAEIQRIQGALTWFDPAELTGLMEE